MLARLLLASAWKRVAHAHAWLCAAGLAFIAAKFDGIMVRLAADQGCRE